MAGLDFSQPEVLPSIYKEGGFEDKGEMARLQTYVGAIAVGDLVRTTLGPRGMDKILRPLNPESRGRTIVTNDGATILKSVWADSPASKILIDTSLQQDAMIGDGTTGVVVLATELLREAEQLVDQNLAPAIIMAGFHEAQQTALKQLEAVTVIPGTDDDSLRQSLMNIARTALSSKLLSHEKDHFSKLAVDAILRTKGRPNQLELIQVVKKCGGTLKDSFLDPGFILEKRFSDSNVSKITNCKVLIANTPMDTDKVKIFGARVHVSGFDEVAELETAERAKMKKKVEKIVAYGCNVFINRQLIYNYPNQIFREAGVCTIEHSDFDGMERLAACLGGEILSTFDTPNEKVLGYCDSIEEIYIGDDKFLRFSGCRTAEACTVVLRGSSEHMLEEAERSLHDALAVLTQYLTDRRVVIGGGAVEMAMAEAVESHAKTVAGKKSLAIEKFAAALRKIPFYIADNGGLDAMEIVARLKAAHAKGQVHMGIDIEAESIGNAAEMGLYEARVAKASQLNAAVEAAIMIIRVDTIVRCPPRERSK